MSSSPPSRFLYFAALILLGWMLSLFYGLVGRLSSPGWLSIALLHSLLAGALWAFSRPRQGPARWGAAAFLPAIAIVLASAGASLLSRAWMDGAPPLNASWDPRVAAFVLWIPVVEELVFRYGIGGWARQRLGSFWGAYGSALVFAMAHGSGVWYQPTVPPGPLLLALCCEWLYVKSGRLTAAMAFHAACNASGWIFAAVDDRWLSWLQALYLKV